MSLKQNTLLPLQWKKSDLIWYTEKQELNTLISSGGFDSNQEFLDGFLLTANDDGLDRKSACGLSLGTISPINNKAIDRWEVIKEAL